MNVRHSTTCLFISSVLALTSCSDSPGASTWTVRQAQGDEVEYDGEASVFVFGGKYDTAVVVEGYGDGCAVLDGRICIDPHLVKRRYCHHVDAQADVIMSGEGEIWSVVCYPSRDGGTRLTKARLDEDANLTVPQSDNGVTLFAPETDDQPLAGDVDLIAERVTLYGNGVDDTTIAGSMNVSSNNAHVRGLTIAGDAKLDRVSNNSSLVYCEVHGDLVVDANNATIANCAIFGDLVVSGNNVTLTNVAVQGAYDVDNHTTRCGNVGFFVDEDEDFDVDREDLQAMICGDGIDFEDDDSGD